MSTFTLARVTTTASSLAIVALSLAGCSSSDSPGPESTASGTSAEVTITDAAPASTIPPASPPASPPSSVSSPVADSPGSSQPPANEPTPTAGTPELVDPTAFAIGEGYYFLSPDGGAFCAIFGDGASGNYSAGCQSEVPPPDLADCEGGPTAHGAVWLGAGGASGLACFNQGIFVSQPTSEGRNILASGQVLSVRGYTCTGPGAAVTCRSDAASTGFTASGAGVSLL